MSMPEILRRDLPRELPCALTDNERLQRAIEAAKKRGERNLLEDQAAELKETAKRLLADHDSVLERLDSAVRDGSERRLIRCHERFHAGMVELVRDDTLEVVESRPATFAEAQRTMPGVDPPTAAIDGIGVVRLDTGEVVGDVVESCVGDAVFVAPDDEDGIVTSPGEPTKKGGKRR